MKALILCLLPLALHAAENKGAYRFVENLYSRYQNQDTAYYFSGPGADTIFAPELLKLIKLDEKLANGEVGYLDGDPLCECQDAEGFVLEKIKISRKSGVTYADVSYAIGAEKRALQLKLKAIKGKWLISDVFSNEMPGLVKYLSKNLSKTRG
jgi:hypothetical protein